MEKCPQCGASVAAGDRFCQECGATMPEAGGPSSTAPAARRLPIPLLAGAGIGVLAIAAAVFWFANSGGDNKSPSSPASPAAASPTSTAGPRTTSATATPATAATPTRPAPTSTATPSPTPAPVATPTPTTIPLPTPILPGFPTIVLPAGSPDREIIDAVNRNGPAYSAALSRLDTAPLSTVFADEALAKYTAEVRGMTAARKSDLISIELVSMEKAEGAATVRTRERWQYTVGSVCTGYSYEETYVLQKVGSAWFITKNTFVQTSSTTVCVAVVR